jgi:hypothetical protein
VVVKWAVKEGVSISPYKTTIVPFTNRKRVEDLGPLTLYGNELKILGDVKYLGLTLDSKLNWNQYLQKIEKRKPSLQCLDTCMVKDGVLDVLWCTSHVLG